MYGVTVIGLIYRWSMAYMPDRGTPDRGTPHTATTPDTATKDTPHTATKDTPYTATLRHIRQQYATYGNNEKLW